LLLPLMSMPQSSVVASDWRKGTVDAVATALVDVTSPLVALGDVCSGDLLLVI